MRSLPQTEELYDYLIAHGTPPDEILEELTQETEKIGWQALMQIPPDQGAFMMQLTKIIQPKLAVEVGTFTGYSALWIARGLPEDAKLICMDINEEWTAIAQKFWQKAGLAHKIELQLAPAIESLRALPEDAEIGLAFIDADKPSYISYYEEIVPRLAPKGAILVDNVLWGGNVADASDTESDTEGIRAFNRHVADDPRTSQVIMPIGDGVTLITKV